MLDAISATQTAMLQDQLRLQSINQNVSNMLTPGYKPQVLETTTFDEQMPIGMATVNQQIQLMPQNSQGAVMQSGMPGHLALTGEGYFEVLSDNGVAYTRRGDFHINEHGELAMQSGARLLGQNGVIRVDDNAFTIDAKGNVFIDHQKVAQISIVQFDHQERLKPVGQGLFASDTNPAEAKPSTSVLQGYLEQSSVKSVDEMMNMMRISRHFETSQRVMHTVNNVLSTAIHQLGESNV